MPQGRRSCHSQVVDRYWRPRTGPATRLWPRHPPSRFVPVQKPGFYAGLGPHRDTCTGRPVKLISFDCPLIAELNTLQSDADLALPTGLVRRHAAHIRLLCGGGFQSCIFHPTRRTTWSLYPSSALPTVPAGDPQQLDVLPRISPHDQNSEIVNQIGTVLPLLHSIHRTDSSPAVLFPLATSRIPRSARSTGIPQFLHEALRAVRVRAHLSRACR